MDEADEGPWAVAGASAGRLGDTVRDRVARELRDRILTGRYERGERLDLDAVGAELGTSRTPVREACLALQTEGLLRMAPRSGVTVLGVEPQEVLDNFLLMARLSGFAAELAAQRITGAELAEVAGISDAMREASQAGKSIAEPNWRFHREIHRACRSRRLISLIAQTGRSIPRTFLEVFPEHVPCALDEHDELVEALRRRDGDEARRVTERHYAVPAELVSGVR
ncbi:GntR family transcriptional regulator [Actinomycetospora endophytica]|uniref:GntR family transcriptional regulator n=1 Tax=Actinomycetospora endophytica TaxID=2291215 RepID=A0ABS8PAQ7_9PSEU|nr:GntR family transcriptional regulator [Actinomycetospora endophytica]MCD2195331.1 GntR family transcriptional regulator [Actinomycetospora endophytica]